MICNIHISVEHAPDELDVPVVDSVQRFAGVTPKGISSTPPKTNMSPTKGLFGCLQK